MLWFDYHLHTAYSLDSQAPMEDMVKRACALGLTEIALTDHVDYDGSPLIDYDAYTDEFERLKERYKDRIRLTFGVEIGLGPGVSKRVKAFVERYDFDFVIGSSHGVGGKDLYNGDYFRWKKDKKTAYTHYFVDMLHNIDTVEDFCVYGHLDFISRYGPYADHSLPYETYRDQIDAVLRRLSEKGKGLEINTSGFRYGIGQPYPQLDILKRYRELGGEIVTIGSDAHAPDSIAHRFDAAEALLAQAGFAYVALYRNREPQFYPLK